MVYHTQYLGILKDSLLSTHFWYWKAKRTSSYPDWYIQSWSQACQPIGTKTKTWGYQLGI